MYDRNLFFSNLLKPLIVNCNSQVVCAACVVASLLADEKKTGSIVS